MTFLGILFLFFDRIIFVNVVIYYFVQTEQKVCLVTNICSTYARAHSLNAEQAVASALKERAGQKPFYSLWGVALELYLSDKPINVSRLEMPSSCLETQHNFVLIWKFISYLFSDLEVCQKAMQF